ncbi:hypothetical protein M011DRAFT_512457 [Sporormia fimetaria CBS 119925]|uniref:Uncharacterized protein n=1 Tax=Sporormia fimetaria CBS 119925 TaxID=1340428 RepID=A0A6A6UXY1_9PLEO|nr:hypothetical protein M011DRAFT_512457 [Sporormia fimetaria CBS 119925]
MARLELIAPFKYVPPSAMSSFMLVVFHFAGKALCCRSRVPGANAFRCFSEDVVEQFKCALIAIKDAGGFEPPPPRRLLVDAFTKALALQEFETEMKRIRKGLDDNLYGSDKQYRKERYRSELKREAAVKKAREVYQKSRREDVRRAREIYQESRHVAASSLSEGNGRDQAEFEYEEVTGGSAPRLADRVIKEYGIGVTEEDWQPRVLKRKREDFEDEDELVQDWLQARPPKLVRSRASNEYQVQEEADEAYFRWIGAF